MAKTKRTSRGSARKATRQAAGKSTRAKARTRASAKRAGKLQTRKATGRKSVKAARKSVSRASAQKKAVRRPARPAASARKAAKRPPAATPKSATAPARRKAAAKPIRRPPALDRERRRVPEEEPSGVPSSLNLDRSASSVRTGREELREKLHRNTSTGPAMTAGDVDADWESAATVGDEAPGGDNPTPDQDVVDEIGKALGVEYDDDEELQGGEEIADRDRHRWDRETGPSEDNDDREED